MGEASRNNDGSMGSHEHFEELCALATAGELCEDEWSELEEHLRDCATCRNLARDFKDVCLLLTLATEAAAGSSIPDGMTERFVARARSQGIPLNDKVLNSGHGGAREHVVTSFRRYLTAWAAAAIILLAAGSILLSVHYGARGRASRNPELSTAGTAQSELLAENEHLKSQLRDALEEERTISTRLRQEQHLSESGQKREAELKRRLSELEKSNKTLHDEESSHNAEISQLTNELERVRAQESADSTASLVSETELSNLRERMEKLNTQLRQTQALNASLNEARDLIFDRNVHVLYVYPEVDENGHPQQARGKIFYAEGKKLVFIAYDLTDPNKISAKTAFYVWGEGPRTAQRVVSLGKFQLDSRQDGRWVLRVTDGRLLAQITSVFVTLEQDKSAITQPTGKRMLSRLLDAKAK
jgi:hypothetical protein